jgi:hypothetical protein
MMMERALQGDEQALNWYRAKRGLDVAQETADRQFWGKMINSSLNAAGSMAGAAATMGAGK